MIKELRFTRSGQAVGFGSAGILCLALSGAVVLLGWKWNDTTMPEPVLPTPWLGVAPALVAGLLIWQAWRLVRQPLLAMTPVGLEIYPFIRPKDNWQLVVWAEVESIQIDARSKDLVVKLSSARNAGICVSLRPLSGRSHALLERAVDGLTAQLAPDRRDRIA